MFELGRKLEQEEEQLIKKANLYFTESRLSIQKGAYLKLPWHKIFPLLASLKSKHISFFHNNQDICLHSIFTPQFHQLQGLYLTYNKIKSVQAFSRLYAPNLREISLFKNQITNIKALRKGCLANLEQINLSQNPIREPESLVQFDFKKIKGIYVEIWPNLQHIGESKRWVVKLSASNENLSAISLQSKSRRKEQHIDLMVSRKYSSLITS